FGRRLAPVQVSHFGYPNTTGLQTMDYRITDAYADPPGETEPYSTEELVRLPEVAWCYQPSTSPDVRALPSTVGRTGNQSLAASITLGSFNNLVKITSQAVVLWSRILLAVPNSRLLLLSDGDSRSNQYLRGIFEQNGISGERVEFVGRRPRQQYLE